MLEAKSKPFDTENDKINYPSEYKKFSPIGQNSGVACYRDTALHGKKQQKGSTKDDSANRKMRKKRNAWRDESNEYLRSKFTVSTDYSKTQNEDDSLS